MVILSFTVGLSGRTGLVPMIQTVLEATLQLDPKKRELGKVIECLSGRFVPKKERFEFFFFEFFLNF